MRNAVSKAVLFMLIFGISTMLTAQAVFQGGINVSLGFPHGEFSENLDARGYGLEGKFLYNIPETPVSVGAGFSFLMYGRDSREVPFSMTIPDVYVDVITTNSIMYGHLMLRLQPPGGAVRPYLDVYGGFGLFTTDTEVRNQNDWSNDDEIASSNNMRDYTSSYGAGAGIQFRVAGPRPFEDRGDSGFESVYIEAGGKYLKGGEAEYLKKNGIEVIGSTVTYDTKKSYTDIIMGYIGVIFTF